MNVRDTVVMLWQGVPLSWRQGLGGTPEFGTDDGGDDCDAHELWSSLIPGVQRNCLSWRRVAEQYGSPITE
jgi:hypothetical protein